MTAQKETPLQQWMKQDEPPSEESKAEETSTEEQTSEASVEETPKEEQLILGKYKTQADLEKAYKELERHLGRSMITKIRGEWVNSETGEPLTDEQLEQAVYNAMQTAYGPKKETPKAETTPAEQDEEYIDPVIQKRLEDYDKQVKALNAEIADIKGFVSSAKAEKYGKEVDAITEKLKTKFEGMSDLTAYKIIGIAGRDRDPMEVAEEVYGLARKDHETYVKGKQQGLKTQVLKTEGGAPVTRPKKIQFGQQFNRDPEAVTPLAAWLKQDGDT